MVKTTSNPDPSLATTSNPSKQHTSIPRTTLAHTLAPDRNIRAELESYEMNPPAAVVGPGSGTVGLPTSPPRAGTGARTRADPYDSGTGAQGQGQGQVQGTSFIPFPTPPDVQTGEPVLDVGPATTTNPSYTSSPTKEKPIQQRHRPSNISRAREALGEGLGTLWDWVKPPEMPVDNIELEIEEEDRGKDEVEVGEKGRQRQRRGTSATTTRKESGVKGGGGGNSGLNGRAKGKLMLERTRSRTTSAIGNGFHRIRTRTKSGRESIRAAYPYTYGPGCGNGNGEAGLQEKTLGSEGAGAGQGVRCVVVDNDVWKEDEKVEEEGEVEVGTGEARTSMQSERRHHSPRHHQHHHHHHHHHQHQHQHHSHSHSHTHPAGRTDSGEHAWATGSHMECGRRPSVSSSTTAVRRWFTCTSHCLQDFFATRFDDPERETHYLQEAWVGLRQSAMPTSLLYILAWGLTWGLSGRPLPVYNRWAFIFTNGFLSVPLPFFVAIDLMRRISWLYQCWVLLASWAFAYAVLIDMHVCGYYTGHAEQCINSPNFIALFFWSIALPVFGLLGLGQKRLFHLIGLCIWCALTISLIIVPGAPNLMIRNLILMITLHVFLVVMSYFWEKSSRRMFILRAQIKDQYMKTEMARRAEALANQSSRRFIAYVFHEIRGPLNRCTLNFGLFVDEHVKEVNAEQQEMVASVNNDFQLMSRVLNDVLSLDKIRLGMLEPSIEPFRLDQTVTLAVNGFRSQANALGLQLQLEADPKISELVLLGDAGRIQQLVGNLIGNSLKFTRQGGVTIITRLLGIAGRNASMSMATTPTGPECITPMVLPVEELNGPGSLRDVSSKGLSSSPTASSISSCHSQSRRSSVRPARNRAIVRFEIRDTGVGFSSQDLDENRLFSEYRQTKIGQKQGASGSGLGLALCRKFIEVFGGRLGVDSEPGKGSTFWFEIPFPIHSAVIQEEVYVSEAAADEVVPLTTGSLEEVEVTSAAKVEDPIVVPTQELPAPPGALPSSDLATDPASKGDAPPLTKLASKAKSPLPSADDPLSLDCLVVDDCPMTRTLMSKILRRMGHRVSQADDGVPALQMIREREEVAASSGNEGKGGFDVVFLDNMMPVMTGEEAVRELRKRGCRVFVVGATGNALKEDQDAYVAAGVDEILTKPVFADKIKRVVGIALERKKARTTSSGAKTNHRPVEGGLPT